MRPAARSAIARVSGVTSASAKPQTSFSRRNTRSSSPKDSISRMITELAIRRLGDQYTRAGPVVPRSWLRVICSEQQVNFCKPLMTIYLAAHQTLMLIKHTVEQVRFRLLFRLFKIQAHCPRGGGFTR